MLMTKVVSCGIILCPPAGWVIAHSTGNKHWDFPKGIAEVGEPHYLAALRELQEETGFVFDDQHPSVKVRDLGQHSYTSGKDLHMWWVYLPNVVDIAKFKCTSMFEAYGKQLPEVDYFLYKYPEEALPMLAKSMQAWVKAHVPAELLS